MTIDCPKKRKQVEPLLCPAMDLRVASCVLVCLLVIGQVSRAAERHGCPASSCPQPHESLDLSPLQGLVYGNYSSV